MSEDELQELPGSYCLFTGLRAAGAGHTGAPGLSLPIYRPPGRLCQSHRHTTGSKDWLQGR